MLVGDGSGQARSIWLVAALIFVGVGVVLSGLGEFPSDYRSTLTLMGWPLLAVGDQPQGWISLGAVPTGFIAIGGLPVGVVAIGGVSVGILSVGGLAAGILAGFGGGALGYHSLGGLSVGAFAFAGGGRAIGYFLAEGGSSERLMFDYGGR